MLSPYDWQEGIGHRAQYVESRLASGAPVLVLSIEEGIVAFTVRRQARKLFEIYDRLLYSAIGQQSDVESLRVAAIDFTHQEGYQRSEEDVTIQRVVAALSNPLKRAFADFNTVPFVARSLFAEVEDDAEKDSYYILDYDGDYSVRQGAAYLVGSEEGAAEIKKAFAELDRTKLTVKAALAALKPIWAKAMDPTGEKDFEALTENLTPEATLLERHPKGENRFRVLEV
ncbi:MAG: hypothetical protein K1X67_23925 [Fimbriimonadaceae bacterium]|nr:hypothetical protein [Fimbriimonadaceae bacterium]